MKLLVVTQKVDIDDENLGFFHRWIEEFAKYFEEIFVIAHEVGSHTFPPHVFLNSLGREKGRGRLKKLWKFWELFSANYAHCDAIFFHMIPEYVLAASPFLVARRRPSALWYVHKSVTAKLKLAELMADYVFTASDLSFRLPSKKVIYTGHAIDTDTFKPAGNIKPLSSGLSLLSVGRVSPVKELETVIRACAVLKESLMRPWSLSIVGGPLMPRDREYMISLKKLVEEKGLKSYVHFHGSRPYTETPSIYQDHDIFISMSTTGSIDKSVLEAMASGLTTVTANESFQPLLPGKYFLEKRSPEFLAERIKMLADENRPNMALRELVVKNHSLEKTIKQIVDILKLPL